MEDKVKELFDRYKEESNITINRSLKLFDFNDLRLDWNIGKLNDYLLHLYDDKGRPHEYMHYADAVRAVIKMYEWAGNPAGEQVDFGKIGQEYYIEYNTRYGLDHLIEIYDNEITSYYRGDVKLQNYMKLIIRLMSAGVGHKAMMKMDKSGIDEIGNTVTIEGETYYLDSYTIDLLKKVMEYGFEDGYDTGYCNLLGHDFPIYTTRKLYNKIKDETDEDILIKKITMNMHRLLGNLNELYDHFPLAISFFSKRAAYQELVDLLGLENARYFVNPASYERIPQKASDTIMKIAIRHKLKSANATQIRKMLTAVCW